MRVRGVLVLMTGLFLAGGSVLVAHSYLQKMTSPPGEAGTPCWSCTRM